MNNSSLAITATGLILLIVVLLNILALREAYLGKPQWQFIHLMTCPVLFYYILKHRQLRRQNRDADKE